MWIKVVAPHDTHVQASQICAIGVHYSGWHCFSVMLELASREYVYRAFNNEADAQACAKKLREEIDSI